MSRDSTTTFEHPLIATATSVAMMVLASLVYLALNDWFAASDILPFILWTLPFSALVYMLVGFFRRVVGRFPIWVQYVAALSTALVVGLGYPSIPSAYVGPWINAFSLPVGALWLIGSMVSFMTAMALRAPATWRVALVLAILVPVGTLLVGYRISVPPPDLIIVMGDDATQEQIDDVWAHGIGTSTERGIMYPAGVSVVSAAVHEGKQAIRVGFHPATSQLQIDRIRARVKAMPGVAKVIDGR